MAARRRPPVPLTGIDIVIEGVAASNGQQQLHVLADESLARMQTLLLSDDGSEHLNLRRLARLATRVSKLAVAERRREIEGASQQLALKARRLSHLPRDLNVVEKLELWHLYIALRRVVRQ